MKSTSGFAAIARTTNCVVSPESIVMSSGLPSTKCFFEMTFHLLFQSMKQSSLRKNLEAQNQVASSTAFSIASKTTSPDHYANPYRANQQTKAGRVKLNRRGAGDSCTAQSVKS